MYLKSVKSQKSNQIPKKNNTYPQPVTEGNIIYLFGKPTEQKPAKKVIRNNGTVDPIKDKADIEKAKQYFLSQPLYYKKSPTNIRNYTLFVLGINSARRIGDMLQFRIKDVADHNGSPKDYICLTEQKRGKHIKIYLNNSVKNAIRLYLDSLQDYSPDDMLFKSRKGKNNSILPSSAWRIMDEMSEKIGLKDKGVNVGTHSCRKTKVYHLINDNRGDAMIVATACKMLGHDQISTTLRYAGIDDDVIKDAYMSNQL